MDISKKYSTTESWKIPLESIEIVLKPCIEFSIYMFESSNIF